MNNKILGLIGSGLAVVPFFSCAQPVADVVATFSRTIADRNIFNPRRGTHDTFASSPTEAPSTTPAVDIQFVGTMSYEKGEFAFFQGSTADLNQIMQVGDKMAGYTIRGITGNRVELESAGAGSRLELTIGDGLQQEKGKWAYHSADELQKIGSFAFRFTPNASPSLTPNEPSSATEPNDVLKRLMQQREKENQ